MYEYTDKVVRVMRKRFIRAFDRFAGALSFDELHVLESAKALYAELASLAEKNFLSIAKHAYRACGGRTEEEIELEWILEYLEEYDPVTKYVYTREVERKRARFAESVIAGKGGSRDIETGLRYWSRMVTQYAVGITDRAAIAAYKSRGVTHVVWVTVKDERCCAECLRRDGKIYDIDKIPPKPHIGCRCILLPHSGGDE